MIGPGERPQEIYTGQDIIDAILRVWPHIEFDPSSGPDSIVHARRKAFVPATYELTPGGKSRLVYTPRPYDIDGLAVEWPDYSYCNPPFGLLEKWMRKAAKEAARGREIMQLAPVRTHRVWWRKIRRTAKRVCWLNPVKFIGYKSGFPAPLCMLYWGDLPESFAAAFELAGLGDVE